MACALENPDRNFSADGDAEGFERLRRELPKTEAAMPYNEAAKLRIGKTITEVVLPSRVRRPVWPLGPNRARRGL